jgi:hypothetical protein
LLPFFLYPSKQAKISAFFQKSSYKNRPIISTYRRGPNSLQLLLPYNESKHNILLALVVDKANQPKKNLFVFLYFSKIWFLFFFVFGVRFFFLLSPKMSPSKCLFHVIKIFFFIPKMNYPSPTQTFPPFQTSTRSLKSPYFCQQNPGPF